MTNNPAAVAKTATSGPQTLKESERTVTCAKVTESQFIKEADRWRGLGIADAKLMRRKRMDDFVIAQIADKRPNKVELAARSIRKLPARTRSCECKKIIGG